MVRLLEKDNRKKTIICSVVFLLGAWLVAWLRLRNIDIMKGPFIFPDQVGYFTHAAVLNGLNWYQTTDSWYSYGISIVLAFIMKFTHDMASIYKIAIYINVLLGELGYILGCIFVKQLCKKISDIQTIIISAVTSCCSAYVFQAQVVWAETYVYTIFMLVLVLAMCYAKHSSTIWLLLLTVSVCLLFAIHNRTIVVIPSLMIFVFSTVFTDKKWIRVCIHLAIIIVMVLGTYKTNSMAKIWLLDREGAFAYEETREKEWIYANSTMVYKTATTRDVRPELGGFDLVGQYGYATVHDLSEKNNENDFSGRLFNLRLVLNDSRALLGMLKSFIGAFWYLTSSTVGLAAFGIVFLFKRVICLFHKSASMEERQNSFGCLFVIVCVIATLAETGYNAMWYPEYTYSTDGAVHWEMLFYGRYVELLTMPLAILGFVDIFEICSRKSMLIESGFSYAIQILASVLVYSESIRVYEPLLNLVCVPGIYSMLDISLGVACVCPIIASAMIYILFKISNIIVGNASDSKRCEKMVATIIQLGTVLSILGIFFVNLKSVEEYNNDAQIALNGYDEMAEILHNNTDVKVILDSNSVIRDKYYRIRTQAIDNEIVYNTQAYYYEDADFVFLTDETNVESFVTEHADDNLAVLRYGNYPMIIKGASLVDRLMFEGYEMEMR